MEDSFFSCQIIDLSNLQSTEAGSASSLMDYEDEHILSSLLSPAVKEKSKKPRKCSLCHQLARAFLVFLGCPELLTNHIGMCSNVYTHSMNFYCCWAHNIYGQVVLYSKGHKMQF